MDQPIDTYLYLSIDFIKSSLETTNEDPKQKTKHRPFTLNLLKNGKILEETTNLQNTSRSS